MLEVLVAHGPRFCEGYLRTGGVGAGGKRGNGHQLALHRRWKTGSLKSAKPTK
jgi:hypothetical protein